jgi:hypothetical protein
MKWGYRGAAEILRCGPEFMNIRLHIILDQDIEYDNSIIIKWVELAIGGKPIHKIDNLTGIMIGGNEIVIPLFLNQSHEYPIMCERLVYHQVRVNAEFAIPGFNATIRDTFIDADFVSRTPITCNSELVKLYEEIYYIPYFIDCNLYTNLIYANGMNNDFSHLSRPHGFDKSKLRIKEICKE